VTHHAHHLLLQRADRVAAGLVDGLVVAAEARVLAVEQEVAVQVSDLHTFADPYRQRQRPASECIASWSST